MTTKTPKTSSATDKPKSGGLPAGVPPLTPDPDSLAAALGGPPVPMQITTVDATVAVPRQLRDRQPDQIGTSPAADASRASNAITIPPPSVPVATPVAPLDATFAPPRENLILRQQVNDLRAPLLQVILSIKQATKVCPPLIEAIRPSADIALTTEHFDLAKAEKFLAAVQAALADITAA
jgi:hypothetical protein